MILDGSGSSDPDNDPINFVWMQIAGPTVALSDARTARPKFSAPDVGTAGTTLKFQLTVTDDSGLKDTDTCVVNVAWVNSPPKADAGSDQNTAISDRVTLDGSNSKDPDDGIATYKWRQTEGLAVTLSNADNAEAFFDAPEIDQPSVQLTFTLTATDTHGLESEDSCLITIYRDTPLNQAPLADAGDTQTVISGQLVYLDGTGSSDPDGNLDRYQWTQTAGSAVTISDPSSSQPSFVAPQTDSKGDSLAFELTVFDTQPLLSKDTCWVEVQPALDIDIDGDGHGDNDNAFPEDPAEWLDTDADGIGNNADDDDDDDGMPDSWESEYNLNPLNPDDAHMDPDGDGLTNLIEFQGGTNPTCAETSGGWTPVVTSPSDGDTGLSVNGTTVRIDTNGRPDHNVVVHQTLWQILSDDGRTVFFSIISDRHVSKIRIPHMILAPQTAYLCRVRCYGADNSVSDWSQTVHFVTKNIPNDQDLNGVPDDQEVTIGPNPQPSDTIPANLLSAKKSTIVSVDISAGNENATISSAMYVDPTEIEEAPDDALPVPLSMAANKVTTEPGQQVSLRFYFDTPQTSDALRWIKYDNIDGWQDYTNYTRLEQNGRAMDVTLQDGGNGDADGAANGTIINLSGPAHAGLSNSNTTLTGASSGQCFIKSLR